MAGPIDANISLPLTEAQTRTSLRPRFMLHEVVKGDTMAGIAKKHGVTYDNLLDYNLAFNLQTLTKHNKKLVSKLHDVAQKSQRLFGVNIRILPGQVILIPGVRKPCSAKVVSKPKPHVEAVCDRKKKHRDPVYIYTAREPITKYIDGSKDKKLQYLLSGLRDRLVLVDLRLNNFNTLKQSGAAVQASVDRWEQNYLAPIRAKQLAIKIAADELDAEGREMDCSRVVDGEHTADQKCMALRTRLFNTAEQRRRWIDKNLLNYDNDSNGYFSENEMENLIRGAETAYPVRP